MKKRIIILVFILLIFSVSCILVFNMTKIKSIKEPTSIKIDQKEEKNNNDNNTVEETSTNDKSEQEKVVKEKTKEEIKQEVKPKSTTKSNTVQTKQETPKKVEQTPAPAPTQTPNQPVEQPKVKEQTEWEKYGMSEYDYYHKPMWDWARVDYPTHEACIEAGEALGYEILSYSCININSTAGNYLGDMLKVKYPE